MASIEVISTNKPTKRKIFLKQQEFYRQLLCSHMPERKKWWLKTPKSIFTHETSEIDKSGEFDIIIHRYHKEISGQKTEIDFEEIFSMIGCIFIYLLLLGMCLTVTVLLILSGIGILALFYNLLKYFF